MPKTVEAEQAETGFFMCCWLLCVPPRVYDRVPGMSIEENMALAAGTALDTDRILLQEV